MFSDSTVGLKVRSTPLNFHFLDYLFGIQTSVPLICGVGVLREKRKSKNLRARLIFAKRSF